MYPTHIATSSPLRVMTAAAYLTVAAVGSSLINVHLPNCSHKAALLVLPPFAHRVPLCADRLEFKNHHHRVPVGSATTTAAVRRGSGRRRTKSAARATTQRTVGAMQQQSLGRACAIGAATAVAGAYSVAFGMFQQLGAASPKICHVSFFKLCNRGHSR